MTYVRVRQAGTGHELSVPESHVAANPDGYEVTDKAVVDAAGDPLPPKYRTTVEQAAARKPKTAAASATASRPTTDGQQAETKKEAD